jgi:hypothetical protein
MVAIPPETAVDAEGEQVTIDVVQFFFGDAATEAARADGSTDLPPPNDHWIRNVNPELRTYRSPRTQP